MSWSKQNCFHAFNVVSFTLAVINVFLSLVAGVAAFGVVVGVGLGVSVAGSKSSFIGLGTTSFNVFSIAAFKSLVLIFRVTAIFYSPFASL